MRAVTVITTKLHIHRESSLAYVDAAKVLMSFPKFRLPFPCDICGKNM